MELSVNSLGHQLSVVVKKFKDQRFGVVAGHGAIEQVRSKVCSADGFYG